jgi:glycosyltransferase involved in cell wall biosynthesis
MRILTIVSFYKPAYVYGGPVKSISAMCEALAGLGQEMTVLTTNANGAQRLDVPLGEPVNINGVAVFYYPVAPGFPSSYFYSPELLNAFRKQIQNHDIAVLETFLTHAMLPSVKMCSRYNIPSVVPTRGQLLPWALHHKRWKKVIYMSLGGRKSLNRTNALQCSTSLEAQHVTQLHLKPPVFIIPNGVDTSRYAQLPPRGALRKQLGIQDSDRILLVLGRLHRVKNPKLSLQTLIELNREDVHMVYVGPDEEGYKPRLITQAKQAGCSGRIHFTGLLTGNDLMQAFSDSDLLLMPSAMESFGMAAVEALSAGLPVLVSENVPLGPWIERVGAGRCATCDARLLARVTEEILTDSAHLKHMGERGRISAQSYFDISVVAQRLLHQYEAIIATGKPVSEDAI